MVENPRVRFPTPSPTSTRGNMSQQRKRAVIMIGIPASGKSTFAKKVARGLELLRLSADDNLPRDENGNRIHNNNTLRSAWLTLWKTVGQCAMEGRGFLIDTTQVTEISRSPVIGLALGMGFEVTAIFMNTRPEVCLIRNSTREDRIPESRLLGMASNLQPPRMEEGWNAIYRIDTASDLCCWRSDCESVLDSDLHSVVTEMCLGGEAVQV
jgi:predicted kinase